MNDYIRIPKKRPILFELFCPKCGGSLYALDEEEFYIGRPEHKNLAGFSITKLECVLCREVFDIHDIGLKYEKGIAEELGWPFPIEIPDGPNAIPEHVEKRMRKREQDPDPQGDLIDDYYADYHNRNPSPLEKEVIRHVLKHRGHLVHNIIPITEIALPDTEALYNAQITEISKKSGFVRKKLSCLIHASDCREGDVIESNNRDRDSSIYRVYYVVVNNMFQPIADSRKQLVKS